MNPKTKVGVAVGAVLLAITGGFVARSNFGPTPPPSISPPGSIDATCGTNVTVALNAWLATVPANSYVTFASNACYLVNPTTLSGQPIPVDSGALIQGWNHVTLNGEGAELKQTAYDTGSNVVTPILNLVDTTNVEVENLSMVGPASGGGEDNEGDYGITVAGTTATLITHVSVTNVDGDNFEIWSNDSGVLNHGVTITDSTFTNPGYHGSTVQGVVGFTFAANTMSGGNDITDFEYDGAGGTIWVNGEPTAGGEANILYTHNSFTNVGVPVWLVGQARGNTVLTANWSFTANTFKAVSPGQDIGPSCQCIGGISDEQGDPATGLQFQGNVMNPTTEGFINPGGAINIPYAGSGIFSVVDWDNVNIQSNYANLFNGFPTYFPSTTYAPIATLNNVNGAVVKNNIGSGAISAWSDYPGSNIWRSGAPPGTPIPSTNVVDCGNTFGGNTPNSAGDPTTAPTQHDAAC